MCVNVKFRRAKHGIELATDERGAAIELHLIEISEREIDFMDRF